MNNLALIESLYTKYCLDKNSVSKEWNHFFKGFELGAACYDTLKQKEVQKLFRQKVGEPTAEKLPPPHPSIPSTTHAQFARSSISSVPTPQALDSKAPYLAEKLLLLYRERSYQLATLSPLHEAKPSAEISELKMQLEEEYALSIDQNPHSPVSIKVHSPEPSLLHSNFIPLIERYYASTRSLQISHLTSYAQQSLIYQLYEESFHRPYSGDEKKSFLIDLLHIEEFQSFLYKRYPGEKLFLSSGIELFIPILKHLLAFSASKGVEHFLCTSTHRGRLELLHLLFKCPIETILHELESSHLDLIAHFSGDVRYHYGFTNQLTLNGKSVLLELLANPSHLESIMPVLAGYTQEYSRRRGEKGNQEILPVCIHGDAAFAAQGVVYESLHLSTHPSYRAPPTIHLILNNSIGFTTPTRHRTPSHTIGEIARAFDLPILHINGDDVEGAMQTIELAWTLRTRLEKDVIVELHGYRRHGHTEIEDPTLAQPLLYSKIGYHQKLHQKYAQALFKEKNFSSQEVLNVEKSFHAVLESAFKNIKETPEGKRTQKLYHVKALKARDYLLNSSMSHSTASGIEHLSFDTNQLKSFLRLVINAPEDFKLHPHVEKVIQYRKNLLDISDNAKQIDWATAEALAIAVALESGLYVRFSGQDAVQGTFSQRNAHWIDQNNGKIYIPWNKWKKYEDQLNIFDTPLSEYASLGFEYGVSLANPLSLVIWEAQYGDFANGAQIIIDQYLSSSFNKWGTISKPVLLLPHGQEGRGPEHSSARIERFLELSALYNWKICIPTTPAQYYHALTDHLTAPKAPLIIFTPKNLLRYKPSFSAWEDFNNPLCKAVLSDPSGHDPDEVQRILFCSGKIYYELFQEEHFRKFHGVVCIRIEQMYPFPHEALKKIIAEYPAAKEFYWVQEEPKNMGPWRYVAQEFVGLLPRRALLKCISRPESPSPAPGLYELHHQQQSTIFEEAFAQLTAQLTHFQTEFLT